MGADRANASGRLPGRCGCFSSVFWNGRFNLVQGRQQNNGSISASKEVEHWAIRVTTKTEKDQGREKIQQLLIRCCLGEGASIALWSGTNKNRDVSTGSLARPFAHSFALLTRSLAPPCMLCSRTPLCSLVRSLVTSLTPSLVGKWIIDVSKWPGFVP